MRIKETLMHCIRSCPYGNATYDKFLSLYHKFVLPFRKRNLRKYGARILGEVYEISKRNQLQCVSHYGTLLGLIRDGGFIKYDDDIDFVIKSENVADSRRFVQLMEDNGYVFKRLVKVGLKPLYFTYMKYGINIDFFTYDCFDEISVVVNGSWIDPMARYMDASETSWRRRRLPKICSKEYEFMGVKILIPDNPEESLRAAYGDGWKIPDPHFKDSDRRDEYIHMPEKARSIFDKSSI